MRVLVCGSRTFKDEMVVWDVLNGLYETAACGWMTVDMDPFVVITGGATGADTFGFNWVMNCPLHGPLLGDENPYEALPVESLVYPANWGTEGRSAGPRRNLRMLADGRPEMVWAFVDKPLSESKGTAHMVAIARAANVPVRVVQVYGTDAAAGA